MLDLDAIAAALSRHPEVSEWTVRLERTQGWQLYLVGSERESLRSVETERAVLELHRDQAGTRGSAGLVLAERDQPRLESIVDEAVFMASLNANPPFRLPSPQPYPRVETVDPEIERDPRGSALRLQERLLGAVAREQTIRLSSLEIFLNRGRTRLRTSGGVDATREGTSLHVELVLIARQGDREGESYASHRRRRVDDLDVEREVMRQALEARHQITPGVPATRRGPVVISGDAVESFFEPVIFHTSASTHYRKMNRLQVGAPVTAGAGTRGPASGEQEILGEPLTLAADATLPYGLSTVPFDDEGVPGQRVDLVRDGTVADLWATKRYADYLGIPATGQLGNLVIPPGTATTGELLAQASPTLHVVQFSWFSPDAVSGDFVAEVRLGYEVDGSQATPVKGGSVSGNVFAALANARFSRETVFRGSYQGPQALWFGDLTISGR